MMCKHKSVSIPYTVSKIKQIPFRNRTDTVYNRLININTFLLRTITNLGYGYKRDPLRIHINLSGLLTGTQKEHVVTHQRVPNSQHLPTAVSPSPKKSSPPFCAFFHSLVENKKDTAYFFKIRKLTGFISDDRLLVESFLFFEIKLWPLDLGFSLVSKKVRSTSHFFGN